MTTPTPASQTAAPAAETADQFGQGTEHCCAACGASVQVGWCHAWQRWYCSTCRIVRTDKELGQPPPAWPWMLGGRRP